MRKNNGAAGFHIFIQKSPGEPLHCCAFNSYRMLVAYAVWWMAPRVGFTPERYDILELVQIDQRLVQSESLAEHRYWTRHSEALTFPPAVMPQAVRDRLILGAEQCQTRREGS